MKYVLANLKLSSAPSMLECMLNWPRLLMRVGQECYNKLLFFYKIIVMNNYCHQSAFFYINIKYTKNLLFFHICTVIYCMLSGKE